MHSFTKQSNTYVVRRTSFLLRQDFPVSANGSNWSMEGRVHVHKHSGINILVFKNKCFRKLTNILENCTFFPYRSHYTSYIAAREYGALENNAIINNLILQFPALKNLSHPLI